MMSRATRFAAILGAGALANVMAADPVAAESPAQATGAKWDAWAEFGGYGSNRSDARRGEAALWAPIVQNGRSVLFTDMRGKFFADEQREGNAALGYRFLSRYGWNPGFWIGFDRRHTERGTDFDQISFGAELLSPNWDLRANVYLPLEDSAQVSGASANSTAEVIGGSIFLIPGGGVEELAFRGFDAEAGFRVPIERLGWHGGAAKTAPDVLHHDLRVFLGGYYFDHDDFDDEIAGARVRAEWRIENVIDAWEGSRLTFEAAYQYDDLREGQFEAGLRLRIPLGHANAGEAYALSPQEKRMAEGLRRDTDIVSVSRTRGSGGGGAPQPVEDALSGVDLNSVVMVSNGQDLDAALAGAGGNALIIAPGGATSFGAITVLPNQTLLGGGGVLQVRSLTTGMLATYTAPGSRPTIADNGGVVVTPGHNTHISGVVLDGDGGLSDAININSPSTVFLTNADIQNAYTGVFLGDGANLTVRNTTIADNHLHGIVLGGESTLDIRNSTIRNMNGHAIMVSTGGNASLTIADTVFAGTFSLSALMFDSGTTTMTSSTGNVDAITVGLRCVYNLGSFTGAIGFSDNTAVTQANCIQVP